MSVTYFTYRNSVWLPSHLSLQVASARPQRSAVQVQAVRPDVPTTQKDTITDKANSVARVAAAGALSALVAASALLSANVAHAGADLALGKQVSRVIPP